MIGMDRRCFPPMSQKTTCHPDAQRGIFFTQQELNSSGMYKD
jgi:hypothetical protein